MDNRKKIDKLIYEKDPQAIYKQSFDIITAEAGLEPFGVREQTVLRRLIHACGMVDLVSDVHMSDDFIDKACNALAKGSPIFADVEMVIKGIIPNMLPQDNPLICTLNHKHTPNLALKIGNTRSAAAVELWGDRLEGAVVSIGNAPTALFHLLELVDAGTLPKPAAIIGVPVGFVGAAESKAELHSNNRGIPYLTVLGRRGGSAIAAAAVNALAGLCKS